MKPRKLYKVYVIPLTVIIFIMTASVSFSALTSLSAWATRILNSARANASSVQNDDQELKFLNQFYQEYRREYFFGTSLSAYTKEDLELIISSTQAFKDLVQEIDNRVSPGNVWNVLEQFDTIIMNTEAAIERLPFPSVSGTPGTTPQPTLPTSPVPSSTNTTIPQAPGVDFTIQQVRNIIVGLACWATQISFFVIVFFILFYGFLFFKSQGNPGKVDEAKNALKYGIIGIIVILGAYTIIATVTNALGGQASAIPIDCSNVGQ